MKPVSINYKPLPHELKRFGSTCKFLSRTGEVAIYEVFTSHGKKIGFDVFKVKKQNGGIVFGKQIEPSEVYPCANDFGKTAYFCVTEYRVEERQEQLFQRQIA